MTVILRIILILASVLMLIYMVRKVRKSKVQIERTVFWIVFGIFIIVISIFPKVIYWTASVLGIQSPANLVWITVIFILLVKQFMTTLELSELETKFKNLVEEIALKRYEEEKYSDR